MSAYERLTQLEAENPRLKLLIQKLRAALVMYGKHSHDCGRYDSGDCTCGLEEARKL